MLLAGRVLGFGEAACCSGRVGMRCGALTVSGWWRWETRGAHRQVRISLLESPERSQIYSNGFSVQNKISTYFWIFPLEKKMRSLGRFKQRNAYLPACAPRLPPPPAAYRERVATHPCTSPPCIPAHAPSLQSCTCRAQTACCDAILHVVKHAQPRLRPTLSCR